MWYPPCVTSRIILLLPMPQVAGDLSATAAKNVSTTFKSVSSKAMENEKVLHASCWSSRCAAGPIALQQPAAKEQSHALLIVRAASDCASLQRPSHTAVQVATAAQTTAQAWRGMTDKVATSFKSLNLGSGIWPAGGAAAASGSPSARSHQATGLQSDDRPQHVDNTSPVAPTARAPTLAVAK